MIVSLLALLVLLAAVAVYLLWTGDRNPDAPDTARFDAAARRTARPEAPPDGHPRVSGPAAGEVASPAAADPSQVLPYSSERPLTEADLDGLTPLQLSIARNEIFARNGRIFRNGALRQHFMRYSWYAPRADEVALTAIEQANVRLLQEAEVAKR